MPLRTMRIQIGQRLRVARLAAKVTLEEAGHEVGRTKSAVLAWEDGSSDMAVTQLAVLCARYGVSSDAVLFGVRTTDAHDHLAKARRRLIVGAN